MTKALSLKNLKMKKGLRQQVEESDRSKGKDTRFLNYYDLNFNEKMKVLIIPDKNGELWSEFKLHGPNLKNRRVGTINCSYTSNNQECPACQHGFDLLNLQKETGNIEYKEEAKKWFGREYTIMSVLVLESPIEVQESPDGNQIKLMYVPFNMRKVIKEAIIEGQVEEDMITSIPFIIKKTKNQGNQAAYDSSYFARETVTDEELEYFDDLLVEQYDYSDLDIIPDSTTTEEVREWLEKALDIIEEHGYDSDTKERDTKEEKPAPRKGRVQENDDDGPEEGQDEPAEEEKEEEAPVRKPGGLRDKLLKAKRSA